jgi:hypothetical protein
MQYLLRYFPPTITYPIAQKAKEREERVAKLVETLARKLSIFAESATGVNDEEVTKSWRTICQLEAECVGFHSGGSGALINDC